MQTPAINDPLEKYPASLRKIIETFEVSGLSAACQLAKDYPLSSNELYQKGLQKDPASQQDLGVWLWSCYFDAHWMSDQVAEWVAIHQRLYDFLNTSPSWIVFHEGIFEKLHDIYQRTLNIHEALKQGSNDLLTGESELVLKRFEAVKPWLTLNTKNSFRIPLQETRFSSDDPRHSFFWDVCCLEQKPVQLGNFSLCSDLLSLCYAVTLQKDENVLLFPVEAGSQLQEIQFQQLSDELELTTLDWFAEVWKKSLDYAGSSLSKRMAYFCRHIQNESRSLRFAHYGPAARMSLLYRYQLYDWNQNLQWRDIPLERDCLAEQTTLLYQESSKKRLANISADKKLPRVLHITSQIIDQKHAPSKILYRMLAMSNREKLDQALIVTESLTQRPADYPGHLRHSGSSEDRGKQFINFLDKEKFAYLIERVDSSLESHQSLENMADALAQRIRPIDADAIVFHGPEPLHHALAARLEGPVKIMFEHGTLPKAPGFDIAICCLEDTQATSGEKLKEIGTQIYVLPFAADSRWTWKADMPKKEQLAISDEYRIATTISNHLETRLTPEFCYAISEILKRVPDLFYVPIGHVQNPKELLQRFEQTVQNRIRFLGAQDSPSNFTRCMDIYFNEFPFGSCYGILDAMASGCPVVSMYDPKGPPQARYGGLFIGKEEGITSGRVEDYIEKACQWLHNPLEYFKASQKAFQHYEWRSNYWAYIEQFENCLLDLIKKNKASLSK